MSVHQHRFRPGIHTSSGQLREYSRFECRCGAYVTEHPGMPVREWRWTWLSEKGLTREWRRRMRGTPA